MGMFDLSKFLPLKEKDRPKGVITATGVESYEDFAKKELSEYHQHGTVSDLLGVIGLGGKASRDWSSSAAESFASEEKSVNSGVVAQSPELCRYRGKHRQGLCEKTSKIWELLNP